MRIVLINELFSPRGGGRERYAQELAEGLLARGHEVHLVGYRFEDVPRGAATHAVAVAGWPRAWRMVRFARDAGRTARQLGADVVYTLTQAYPADAAFLASGVHRHWFRTRQPFAPWRWLSHLMRPVHLANLGLEQRMFTGNRVPRLIVNSHLVEHQLMRDYRLPQERITVIHHGANPAIFSLAARNRHRNAMRRELGVAPDDLVLLHVSHNWKRKGVDVILRALGRLSPTHRQRVRLVVAGRGKPAPFVRLAQRLRLGGQVTFLAAMPEIEKLYAGADVFVLPTLYDPFAMVTVEAMAMGLPVITPKSNGGSEIITHAQSGYVTQNARDHKELAGLLTPLLDEPARLPAMSQAAALAAQALPHDLNITRTIATLTGEDRVETKDAPPSGGGY